MTSKEFIRKVSFYRVFAGVIHLFSDVPLPDVESIWKVEIIGLDTRCTSFISLLSELSALVSSVDDCVKSILIDEFDILDLRTQLRYFKSFFDKCTIYQQEVIRQDSELCRILHYVESHKI